MYIPVFAGPIEGWTVRWSSQHLWRVAEAMEWDDVMQEAYLVFLRCSNKYPVLDTPQHFMALYKRAWVNHFNDLSTEVSRNRAASLSLDDDGESQGIQEPAGDLDTNGHLRIMIEEAPKEVRMVLSLLLNAPQELVDVALAGWNGTDRRKTANGSKRICQMLGLPQHLDVMGMVRDYFTH